MPMPIALPLPAASPPAANAPFQFKGARLGMSLADWRAMPFPGSSQATSNAKPVCSDDPQGPSSGVLVSPSERQAGVVVCTYVSRWGRYVLPQAVAIDSKYQAQNIRYAFRAGRLFSIRYQTTVDAFDDLARQLDSRYGLPVRLVRDDVTMGATRFARVRQTWRGGGLTIDMVDPVPPTYRLSISFTASGPAQAGSSLALKLGPRLPPA